MIKRESPVKKFPGHVMLPDYLNVYQVRKIEDAFDELVGIADEKKKMVWLGVIAEKRLPAILECVQEWHIEGVPDKPTMETFPFTPVAAATDLVGWLFDQIRELWAGEQEVPNE